jgi:hypothetical protein
MPHVTFIHGIGNKPPQERLLNRWLRSLAQSDGLDLGTEGVTSSMIYWADVLYPEPSEEAVQESAGDEAAIESSSLVAPDLGVERMNAEEQRWVATLAIKLAVPLAADAVVELMPTPMREHLERVPLPWPVKERLMRLLLRDLHHYLFNAEFSPRPGTTYRVQDEIRNRTLRSLKEAENKKGPHVVVSHSMGTVIMYDCLKRVADVPDVDALMTVGSPLGIDEVQDKLEPGWTRADGFPRKIRNLWINVYDLLDPVTGFDSKIANDYQMAGRKVIKDLNEQNWGAWRHDMTKYLQGEQFRGRLRTLLSLD